jgi:hypothetical protein
MGEAKDRELAVRQQVLEALGLQSADGQIKVRWDKKGQATAQGQMAFFIEFLSAAGQFDQWVADCPVNYKSPNGSTPRGIVGTWMLSILSGHWRYAHVSAMRADGINPGLQGEMLLPMSPRGFSLSCKPTFPLSAMSMPRW